MQHITNKMCGLLSEAIEPKANRRLLPPAPLPEAPPQGRGWGGVMWNKLRNGISRLWMYVQH